MKRLIQGLNYQDRLIFGTDNTSPLENTHEEQLDNSIKTVTKIRDFLETDREMLCGRGLKLGTKVLDKIYHGNFLKLLQTA